MKCKLINENFTSDYVSNLLKSRGVIDIEEYLNPSVSQLETPATLKNIALASILYQRVVSYGGHILIIVDSDVDGYTSAAIIYQYTKLLNPNCKIDYFLHEGKQHGLQDHIDRLMEENISYDLIILPDSSSNDAHYHDMLDTIHVPCLILDHHITDTELSDNAVVVNNQLSPNYINKDLTGAGVVYQFCRFMDTKIETPYADRFVDLAALGIIGDMGSMLSLENRYIMTQGLNNIQNEFLKCLINKQVYSITGMMNASWNDIQAKLNPISIAFYIVPLINALIRVGTMEEKQYLFEAFLDGAKQIPCKKRGAAGTYERADIEVTRICTNARTHQNKIKDDIVGKLADRINKFGLLDNKILFVDVSDIDFPSELTGLVAMQLAAEYKKPTMVGRASNDNTIKGSIRGVNDSELESFKKFLDNSGITNWVQGHDNAAGYCIDESKVDELINYANEELKNYNFNEGCYNINFDRFAYSNDLSTLILAIGSVPNIWGQGTPEPLIRVQNIPLSSFTLMGKAADTAKITHNGISFMRFKDSDFIQQLEYEASQNSTISVVGRANINNWGGRQTPQLFIDTYEFNPQKVTDF